MDFKKMPKKVKRQEKLDAILQEMSRMRKSMEKLAKKHLELTLLVETLTEKGNPDSRKGSPPRLPAKGVEKSNPLQ